MPESQPSKALLLSWEPSQGDDGGNTDQQNRFAWPPEDMPVEVASVFEGLALCAAILHAIWNAFLRSGAAGMVSILSTKNGHMTQ
jgi:hypothetical protein